MSAWYCYRCMRSFRTPGGCGTDPRCPFCQCGFVEETLTTSPSGRRPELNTNPNPSDEPSGEGITRTMHYLNRFLEEIPDSRRPTPFFFSHGHDDEFPLAFRRPRPRRRRFDLAADRFIEQLLRDLADDEAHGLRGPPPASRASVEALDDFVISEGDIGGQCAVCKDEFEVGKRVKRMPCSHIYDSDCILPWLEQHNSCPVCRFEMPTDDPEYDRRRIAHGRDGASSSGIRPFLDYPFRASMTMSQQAQMETSSGPANSGETITSLLNDADGSSSAVHCLEEDGDLVMSEASGYL